MTEAMTKEQMKLKKDKEAIAAMKAARDNMATAISRIETLETCIANMSGLIDKMLEHVSVHSYPWDSKVSHAEQFKAQKQNYLKLV